MNFMKYPTKNDISFQCRSEVQQAAECGKAGNSMKPTRAAVIDDQRQDDSRRI